MREVVAIEIYITTKRGIRQVNVCDPPSSHLLHFAPIVFHPLEMTKREFVIERHDRSIVGAAAVCVWPDLDYYLLSCSLLEVAVEIVGGVEIAAVDGQQIVADVDVDSWLGERRHEFWIPILAVEDAREAVAAVLDLVVCTEKTGADLARFGSVSAADEHVPDAHVAQHFAEEVVEVRAAGDVVEIRREEFLGGGKIKTMRVRVVEEIALDAPDFVIDLPPLGARVDVNFHFAELQRAVTRLRHGSRPGDKPLISHFVEHLFAIGGNRERGHSFEVLLRLARLEREFLQRECGRACKIWNLSPFGEINFAFFSSGQAEIIARGDRQSDDSLSDVLEVDVHLRRLFRLLFVFIFVFVLIFVFALVDIGAR